MTAFFRDRCKCGATLDASSLRTMCRACTLHIVEPNDYDYWLLAGLIISSGTEFRHDNLELSLPLDVANWCMQRWGGRVNNRPKRRPVWRIRGLEARRLVRRFCAKVDDLTLSLVAIDGTSYTSVLRDGREPAPLHGG